MKAKKSLPTWINVNGHRTATCFGVIHYIEDNKPAEITLKLEQKINDQWVTIEDADYLNKVGQWITAELKASAQRRKELNT